MKVSLIGVFFASAMLVAVSAHAAGTVATTPPMGWNSWNYFGARVTAADIRAAADAMVSSGMRAAGYTYINIDDGWQGKRGPDGVLHPNARFPDMKALADYVHARGLKLGLYSSPGPTTCAGYTGSYGHEMQDARTFAAWGVDYLKYDLCGLRPLMRKQAPESASKRMRIMREAYLKMHRALLASHRAVVYSLCEYGWDAVWQWGPQVGANLWRTTGDIKPNWSRIYAIASMQAGLARFAGPGHWNDPDMLEVGNGDLTLAEDRSHFSLWAMLAAPLIAGNDLADMPPAIRQILTNRHVIAVDQDSLGKQGNRAYVEGEMEVWTRPLADGAMAVAVLNVGSQRPNEPFHMNWARIGLHGPQRGINLWTGKSTLLSDATPIRLASHDVLMVRIAHPH